jgi:hypothetical protein
MKVAKHVAEVVMTTAFGVGLGISVSLTCGINYVVDRYVKSSLAQVALINEHLTVDVAIFIAIVAFMNFLGSENIVKTIRSGRDAPLDHGVIDRHYFWRWFAVLRNQRRSLVYFVFASLVFPGAAVVVSLYSAAYWMCNDSACTLPNETWLGVTEFWKGLSAAAVFTTNYVAAHSNRQRDLLEVAS